MALLNCAITSNAATATVPDSIANLSMEQLAAFQFDVSEYGLEPSATVQAAMDQLLANNDFFTQTDAQ